MSSFAINQNGDSVDDIPLEYDDRGEVRIVPQLPSDCSDEGEEFGEPDILPRIGDEYQAELPPLIHEPSIMSHSVVEYCSLRDFFVGLPVPLVWINCKQNEGRKTVLDSRHPLKMVTFCNGDIKSSHNSVKPKEEISSSPAEEKMRICNGRGRLLVPGLLKESWSDAEKASFVLALYIFEKNFVEVRRFVESKNMGAILSFYYGEFYGSDVYHRWSEGRKTRSKKCVYGQRIFSASRQQELMSRLLHKVSEEGKSALLKVSKAFSEEKMSLFDYVSSLKAMVGMDLLVEAIAVGSGKQDLTRMALEPSLRSSQVTRSEIPAGKACSALTTSEIIKFLSGDYRLSKARSNDLFWEAVWPRLLARGWHSEQPHNQGYIADSKFLVFLLPGVKKFSRRKLVKGDHYFDSVTDVLSKVAKDPTLIELDNEEANGHPKDELTKKEEVEKENHPPARQRHSYLQPRTPKRSVDSIKFTVVDTCLSGGKVVELRSLPCEISSMLLSLDPPADSDKDTDTGESDTMNSITLDSYGPKKHVSKPSLPLKKKKDSNGKQKPQKVSKKSLPGRKQKQGYADSTAPISKRCRKSSDDTREEARENGTSCCSSGVHESNENLSTQVSSKLSSGSSSRESNPEPQLLIDLNLPHVALELDKNPPSNESTQEPTRRLSTRYRPPTTRALEAVAGGYLSVSRKRKGRDTNSVDAQPPRPSPRPRVGAGPNESPSSSSVASQIGEAEKGATTSGTSNADNKFDDQSEANHENELVVAA